MNLFYSNKICQTKLHSSKKMLLTCFHMYHPECSSQTYTNDERSQCYSYNYLRWESSQYDNLGLIFRGVVDGQADVTVLGHALFAVLLPFSSVLVRPGSYKQDLLEYKIDCISFQLIVTCIWLLWIWILYWFITSKYKLVNSLEQICQTHLPWRRPTFFLSIKYSGQIIRNRSILHLIKVKLKPYGWYKNIGGCFIHNKSNKIKIIKNLCECKWQS